MRVKHLLIASILTITPLATAMAQTYGPETGADNTVESHEIARGSAPAHHYVSRDHGSTVTRTGHLTKG